MPIPLTLLGLAHTMLHQGGSGAGLDPRTSAIGLQGIAPGLHLVAQSTRHLDTDTLGITVGLLQKGLDKGIARDPREAGLNIPDRL